MYRQYINKEWKDKPLWFSEYIGPISPKKIIPSSTKKDLSPTKQKKKKIIVQKEEESESMTSEIEKEDIEKIIEEVLQEEEEEPKEFYEYEGKKYKEGAIINIGYGPKLIHKVEYGRRKKESMLYKKISAKEKGKAIRKGKYIQIEPREGEESEEESKEEEGEEGEEKEEEDTSLRERRPEGEEEKQEENILKAYETDPEPIKKKGQKYPWVISYEGYDKYIVTKDKNGKFYLKSYRPPIGIIEVIDKDVFPPPIPKKYKPKEIEVKSPPKSYKGKLKIKDCVKFTYSTQYKLSGAVIKDDGISLDILDTLGYLHKNIKHSEIQKLIYKTFPEDMKGAKVDEVIINIVYPPSIRLFKVGQPEFLKNIEVEDVFVKNIPKKKMIVKSYWKLKAKDERKFVELSYLNIENFYGIILDYKTNGFLVSIIGENSPKLKGNKLIISYDDPTIEYTECPKRIKPIILEPENYLDIQVENSTRQNIINMFFTLLSNLIPNIYEIDVKDNKQLIELQKEINWNLIKFHLQTWEDYYAEQYKQWIATRIFSSIYANAPSFLNDAENKRTLIIEEMYSPKFLIAEFTKILGEDIFQQTGEYILQEINLKLEKSNFEPTSLILYSKRELSKIPKDDLQKLKESSLALTMTTLFSNFLRTREPPSVLEIENNLKKEWVSQEINKYQPNEKDRIQFESEFLFKFTELYSNYNKNWNHSKSLESKYIKLRRELEEKYTSKLKKLPKFKELGPRTLVHGKPLTNKGINLVNDIIILEEKIYQENNTKTNHRYLHDCIKILMFLDSEDELGKYAEFFREKIKSDIYRVKNLNKGDYYHIFPEFFMNNELSNTKQEKGKIMLEQEILDRIIDYIDLWIIKSTSHRKTFTAKFQWKTYIIPINKIYGKALRVKQNLSYGGVKDILNYECEKTERKVRPYTCRAKLEPIPLEDLIICYDEKTNKFSGVSIMDILHALKTQDNNKIPINHNTGLPYDSKFLDKMRRRYEDILEKEEKNLEDRVILFNATENEVLFGEEEEEVKEIKKVIIPSKKIIISKKVKSKKVKK
jgi:hypothetical protein